MCGQIQSSDRSSSEHLFLDDVSDVFSRIPRAAAYLDTRSGQLMGIVAYAADSVFSPIAETCQKSAEKTIGFIKDNWRQLVAYVSTGLMYGFQTVALPLTIGFACGIAFGLITGILTVKVFDPKGKITLWNLLNQGIEKLDPNGTRQIVLAVAITVLLAASVVFPYVMGALLGIFVGNQLATKAGSSQNLGRDPDKDVIEKERLHHDIASMQQKTHDVRAKLEKIENAEDKAKLSRELGQMIRSLQEMNDSLERLYSKSEEADENHK